MKIEAYIEVWKGNKRILVKPANSFVRQFVEALRMLMAQASADIKATNEVVYTISPSSTNLRVNAGAGASDWGILVGTGTDAVTINDYRLQTPISHGTGPGQLQYGAVSVGTVAVIPPSAEFTIARTFTNLSGADITVNEVGLAWKHDVPAFLLDRSLLTFVIPNGESRTVTYKIKVTV
jgi:hypothetical protein